MSHLWTVWVYVLIGLKFALLGVALTFVVLSFFGCASGPNTAAALRARQRAIQDCILSGGHAQLGPNDTILCAH